MASTPSAPGGPKYEVSFSLPFLLRIGRRRYEVRLGNRTFSVKAQRIDQKTLDPRLGIGRLERTTIARDRHGFVSYSRVTVTLPAGAVLGFAGVPQGSEITDDLLSNACNAAQELAQEVTNRLIDRYRDLRDEFWIRRLRPDEMYDVAINYPDRFGSQQRFMIGINFPGGGITPEFKPTRQASDILAKRLRSSERVTVERNLILDARDSVDQGDPEAAVIEAYSSVEVGVKNLLRRFFRRNPVAPRSLITYLGCRHRKGLYLEDALERGSIDVMLTLATGLATGIGLPTEDSLPPDWSICRRARNLTVHQGVAPNLAEADRAVRAALQIHQRVIVPGNEREKDLHPLAESLFALTEVHPVSSSRFSKLARRVLRSTGLRLTFRSIKFHPEKWRLGQEIVWEEHGETAILWMNPDLRHADRELMIARILCVVDLMSRGFPRARVSQSLPFEDYRLGWEAVAQALTKSVLDLAVDQSLQSDGFILAGTYQTAFRAALAQFSSQGFTQPEFSEVRYWVLPLNVARLYAQLNEQDGAKLIESLRAVAPETANLAERLGGLLRGVSYDGREQVLKSMIDVHDQTMILGSCLILDPPSGKLYGNGGGHPYPGTP